MNHALSNGHDVDKVLESFDKDENHRFETESGKVVTREEAGAVADVAKQRDAKFEGAGLQSEHLSSTNGKRSQRKKPRAMVQPERGRR
jgi:hypothetical protein